MSVETVTYISDLDYTQPLAADPRKQGDDHLRNIKLALRQTFPNITGPITATQNQLNQFASLVPSAFDYMTSAEVAAVQAGTATDITTKLQAAIDDNYDGILYLPAGSYYVTDTLDITDAIHFVGAGRDATRIYWTSTTLDVISVASATAVHFQGLQFSGPASATAGAIISLAHSASGVNYFSSFQDCTFSRGYDQIKTVSAAAWTIRNCYFTNYVRRAVTVESANTPDAGDSAIYGGCVFANAGAGAVGIYQKSSGGLKVNGNKFNGSGAYAYQMQLASAAVTSILLFENNSVENQLTAAMKFDTDGGGATFTQVVISGNQFALEPYMIDISGATAFLGVLSITNNTMALNASGTYGINLANINRYLIEGNTIIGGGGTPVGINIASSCSNGQIGPNNYVSLTTPIADASTSKAKVYFNDTQVLANSFQFPATQVASSDVNCLDDYEEGTWTPVLTFDTPGNLSVAYTTQLGWYTKIGKVVNLWFNIVTSTFTHTTASGSLKLTGVPVGSISTANFLQYGTLNFQGVTKASYTQISPRILVNDSQIFFVCSGSGQAVSNLAFGDMPTGGTVILRGQLTYMADA